MKIRLKSACSFIGLQKVEFPVEVEVTSHDDDLTMFFVSIENMSTIPGWFRTKGDVWDGCKYIFFNDEVEVVVENAPTEAEAQISRQEELLDLIREYGNPFTGIYRSGIIFNKIEKMVKEHLS
ncbi:hypothetical protein MVUOKPPV_CDS0010 [Klebsiella phage phi1_175008]|uniref:Uncharacterized protein n=2 Tax=Klebsiella phage phi1_175008 TaxID=3127744 RepID=A0ACD5FQY9_9CAUD